MTIGGGVGLSLRNSTAARLELSDARNARRVIRRKLRTPLRAHAEVSNVYRTSHFVTMVNALELQRLILVVVGTYMDLTGKVLSSLRRTSRGRIGKYMEIGVLLVAEATRSILATLCRLLDLIIGSHAIRINMCAAIIVAAIKART